MRTRRLGAKGKALGGLAGIVLLGMSGAAWAGAASLRSDAELFALLSPAPACCIIDARSAAARQAADLPGALPYHDGLRIEPTSHAVVVADTDARALAVARQFTKANPHEVYAVKGGLEAWRAVAERLRAPAAKPGSKFGFVIPHNTCEQGKPLQVFKAEGAAAAQSTAIGKPRSTPRSPAGSQARSTAGDTHR